MKTVFQIADEIKARRIKSLPERRDALVQELEKNGHVVLGVYDHLRNTGRAFGVTVLKDKYRISFRCGYGRYNYAPCVEVEK